MRGLLPRLRRFFYMHIIYVDESGIPDSGQGTNHFVVAGMAIPLNTWKNKDSEIRILLKNYRLVDIEIHTAWMARKYPEQERITNFDAMDDKSRCASVEVERKKDLAKASLNGERAVNGLRKNYYKTKNYIHLTHAERIAALQAVADKVLAWGDCRLFGDAQKKDCLTSNQCEHAREYALEQVTTRYNTYLENVYGPNALGIMVHDQNQAVSLKLTGLFRKWHSTGTTFSKISHIAETPLFVDSSLTVMIQIADLVSYATRRFFDNNEMDLFSRIYPRFDRTPMGALVGLRHYTGRTACRCQVCTDHIRIP
jgi:hypothetical protein